MANENYHKAAELRKSCDQQITQLLPALTVLRKDLAEYYELMRWQPKDCTDEEFDTIYGNMGYYYGESNIDRRLEQLEEYFRLCAAEIKN